MPKLNAVLMVLLAGAVIAATGFFTLRPSAAGAPDDSRFERLFRKLADRDVDLRREAEGELRAIGLTAVEPLIKASKSADRILAGRASGLLAQIILRPQVRPAATPEPADPEAVVFEDQIEIAVVCSGPPERAQRTGVFLVELVNHSLFPVAVVLNGLDPGERVAWFEVEDDQGKALRLEENGPVPIEGAHRLATVPPGERLTVSLGCETLRELLCRPEIRSVRFVYDASGSAYRAFVEKIGGAAPLPPVQFTSKTYFLGDAK